MIILIDTNVLIWWFHDPQKLSRRAALLMKDVGNQIAVSAASAWEMSIKVALGKLDALNLVSNLPDEIAQEGFSEVPITVDHGIRAGALPLHHRDPFDRLLVAQAQALRVPIVSSDKLFDRYDVKRLW